jgi:hypothetical protein
MTYSFIMNRNNFRLDRIDGSSFSIAARLRPGWMGKKYFLYFVRTVQTASRSHSRLSEYQGHLTSTERYCRSSGRLHGVVLSYGQEQPHLDVSRRSYLSSRNKDGRGRGIYVAS